MADCEHEWEHVYDNGPHRVCRKCSRLEEPQQSCGRCGFWMRFEPEDNIGVCFEATRARGNTVMTLDMALCSHFKVRY